MEDRTFEKRKMEELHKRRIINNKNQMEIEAEKRENYMTNDKNGITQKKNQVEYKHKQFTH